MQYTDKTNTKVTISFDFTEPLEREEAEKFISAPNKLLDYNRAWEEIYNFVRNKLEVDCNQELTDQEVAIYSEIQDKLIDLNNTYDICFYVE